MPPASTMHEQGPANPPIDYPLKTSASSLTLIWLWFATVFASLGVMVQLLRVRRIIAKGDPLMLYILAGIMLLAVVFNFIVSWRARREFRAIRRGDYLACWHYSPAEAKPLQGDVSQDQTWRVKALFWIPFTAIFGSALVLGVIGAFAKSNVMLAVTISLHALWVGALAGALFAVPAHFLFGVRKRIARELDPVVIFTRSGFYTPGRFVPVMDFAQSRRKVALDIGSTGARLACELHQGMPGRPHAAIPVVYDIPVPLRCLDEARRLLDHYQSR